MPSSAARSAPATPSALESVLVSEADIKKRLRKLGAGITALYGDDEITVISVINGAILFTADLLRHIDNPVRLDCIRVSSYRNETKSMGKPQVLGNLSLDLANRLDDIPAADGASSEESFDFWHPDNVAPMVAYLCSDAASHISGKVFGVQGDVVELYQPWSSVTVITNDAKRWDDAALESRVGELFAASGIDPGAQNMMARLRYSMTDRNRH